jgi:hypothetical protein
MTEQELSQPEIVLASLELRRRRVAPSVHVHPARRPLGNEAGALEAAIPPQVNELPRRRAIVPSPCHVRVADLLVLDHDDLGRILDVDSRPARVLVIEEKVVVLPLRLEIETAEGEPESFSGMGIG